MSFTSYDAVGLAAAIRSGELSAREATEAAIERIEELNPTLNAVVGTRYEEALAEVDAGLPQGPLTGVPTLVKTLGADVAGLPTTRGSRLWADDVKTEDSEIVRRMKAAGMVVLGTTNTPELGKSASTEPVLHGPTPNPRDLTRSAGGSSGGSAVAVATGMVPVAHANDGGGSIRIPAAANGLFGIKPSRGRVPNFPNPMAFSNLTSAQLAVSRTVRDSAAMLDALSGNLPGDVFGFGVREPGATTFVDALGREPGRLRVGLVTALVNGPDVDPELVEATRSAAKVLEGLGHEVVEITAPWDTASSMAASGLLMGASLTTTVQKRLAELGRELREDDLEPFTRAMLDFYGTLTGAQVAEALAGVEQLSWNVAQVYDTVDVMLTPTLCVKVPELGFLDMQRPETLWERGTMLSGFTGVFNVTGAPAMSLPHGTDSNGLPIGVHVVGPLGSEARLLSLAAQFEAAAPWELVASVDR
ncbi:MAG: amidase [Nocardioides sp.]|uniref:amidase n=1 Tax=Nocardioides sp. TaxID=35761 RepID=UPI003F0EDACA